MELNKAKQQLKETDHAISAQQQELDKLNQIINEADEERVRQKKEYDLVMNERDILGMLLPMSQRPVGWNQHRISARAHWSPSRLLTAQSRKMLVPERTEMCMKITGTGHDSFFSMVASTSLGARGLH